MIKLPIEIKTPEVFEILYVVPRAIAKAINKPEGKTFTKYNSTSIFRLNFVFGRVCCLIYLRVDFNSNQGHINKKALFNCDGHSYFVLCLWNR